MSLDCTDVCDAVISRLKDLGYEFSDNEAHDDVLGAFAEVTLVPDKDFGKLGKLLDVLQSLVALYWNKDFITCITPGARRDASEHPSYQRIFDLWDNAKSIVEGGIRNA